MRSSLLFASPFQKIPLAFLDVNVVAEASQFVDDHQSPSIAETQPFHSTNHVINTNGIDLLDRLTKQTVSSAVMPHLKSASEPSAELSYYHLVSRR